MGNSRKMFDYAFGAPPTSATFLKLFRTFSPEVSAPFWENQEFHMWNF